MTFKVISDLELSLQQWILAAKVQKKKFFLFMSDNPVQRNLLCESWAKLNYW